MIDQDIIMNQTLFDVIPIWALFLFECAFSGAALEFGYRYGKGRNASGMAEKEMPVGAMVASILALFAFLLAFTFGMAADRFETRKHVILDESNAIGTTYLRARLLPNPVCTESSRLLREYVDVRIAGANTGNVIEAKSRSEEIHAMLWEQATILARNQPTVITGLYIQSLNNMIDIHGMRIQAGLRNRIPSIIWVVLLFLAALSMAAVGYQAGLAGTRRSPAMLVLILSFVSVMFLIADLNRPMEGFITSGQQPMLDLQSSMISQ